MLFTKEESVDLTLCPIDLPKLIGIYEEKKGKELATTRFKSKGTRVTAQFTGNIFTNGINYKEFENGGKAYTIGLEVEESFLQALEEYEKLLTEYAPEDFQLESMVKNDDHVFIKCKVDGSGKHFAFKSNLKITPKNYSEVSTCSTLQCTVDISAYFNLSTKAMGIYFSLKDTKFE